MTHPIDLSQVPPPDALETLGIDALLEACWADAVAANPDLAGLVESDPARKWVRSVALRELLVRQRVNEGVRACMLPTAKRNDLANLAALFGIERQALVAADPDADPPVEPVLESDERLRRRVQLFPASISTAGPESAWRFHALAASPLVKDVDVASPAPGRVTVTVLAEIVAGADQGVADAKLLAAVTTALSDETVRPMGDVLTVRSAEIVSYRIRARLSIGSGPDRAAVLAAARTAAGRAALELHALGRGAPRSALYAALHVPGVASVNLAQPRRDVAATAVQAAHAFAIEVTAA